MLISIPLNYFVQVLFALSEKKYIAQVLLIMGIRFKIEIVLIAENE